MSSMTNIWGGWGTVTHGILFMLFIFLERKNMPPINGQFVKRSVGVHLSIKMYCKLLFVFRKG